MDKQTINSLLQQIIGAANAIEVKGEVSAAQVLGICRSARQIGQIINAPEPEEAPKPKKGKKEVEDNGG